MQTWVPVVEASVAGKDSPALLPCPFPSLVPQPCFLLFLEVISEVNLERMGFPGLGEKSLASQTHTGSKMP